MASLHYLLLAVALVSIAQAAAVSKKRHPQGDEPAMFYYLVRNHGCCGAGSGPRRFARSKAAPSSLKANDGLFTARATPSLSNSLWPNYNKGGYPENCPGVPGFDDRDISGLVPQLRTWWPSYKGDNEQFWEHEYNTHGTCNINNFDEEAYFAATLKLNDRYPIQAALEAAGIVPDADKTYATSDIEDALAAAWGAKPEVMCACTPGGWRQECQEALIDSILICIDASLKIGPCNYKCTGEEGCEHTNCDRVHYRPL